MYKIIFLLMLGFCFSGCNNQDRRDELEEREVALLAKEKQFALKEAEYKLLLQMRDSVQIVADTVMAAAVWPEGMAKKWNARVVCVASNCTDYVVGDQRSDVWEFGDESGKLVVKAVNSNKLVRLYLAQFDNNTIRLHYTTDSAAAKNVVMHVALTEITAAKMRGVRAVSVDNKCTAIFSVELNRITSNE